MVRKQRKMIKYVNDVTRVLARARDLYIQSLKGDGGSVVVYGNVMGCPTPQISSFPRSVSVNGTTTNHHGGRKVEPELRRSKTTPVFSRIDEDEEDFYGFGDNEKTALLRKSCRV